ncbi:conserved hypothetical protein [Coccidioides posadasii str. Silveira]|uniref:Uncharacterized protein n=2 Tax=Coccidioides posadasii (strain RMSCC 757 / Silveira) TaxID=443226 RepID=E9CR39_COCPS|nr:conserved hypothetical protein [Coccidioides posadasii str. Silveira]
MPPRTAWDGGLLSQVWEANLVCLGRDTAHKILRPVSQEYIVQILFVSQLEVQEKRFGGYREGGIRNALCDSAGLNGHQLLDYVGEEQHCINTQSLWAGAEREKVLGKKIEVIKKIGVNQWEKEKRN